MTTVKEPPNGSKSPSFFKSIVSKLKPLVAPVSPGTQHHTPQKSQTSDRQSRENASRCQLTFADGRQCRNQRASLCAHHASKQKRGGNGATLKAPELEALCSDLTTATNINRALAQSFLLMAQGRISRKDAVAFGYLSQLLLQSVSRVRAEYVAANGYRQWENKLKTSFAPHADDDPEPSPGGDSGPSGGGSENLEHTRNGVVERQKGMSIRPLLPHKEDERRTSPNPTQERPIAERIMGKPDYADILSRSLDLLDRKYDTTPEGRSEANKLALELELMKPAPAKPAKGFFGQTVDLVRRFRDADQQKSGASAVPPALDYYGHPIQTHVVPPPWADKRDAPPPARGTATPGCAHPNPSVSRSEPPAVPDQQACSSEPVAAAVPEAQRTCAPSASDPADFVAPPSRRHRKPRSHSSSPGSPPYTELPLPVPASATAAKHDSLGGPDADHHEGHRTDWYAPPSWSKIRPPDPCPSRKEKLQRKLRSMSNSAFRRLQHRNSRGF
jgi:hypothetical protein